MKNKGLASLSSVVELLNEIVNRSMIQPIDINVDKGMEKSYCIHDMVIDFMALGESLLSKGGKM